MAISALANSGRTCNTSTAPTPKIARIVPMPPTVMTPAARRSAHFTEAFVARGRVRPVNEAPAFAPRRRAGVASAGVGQVFGGRPAAQFSMPAAFSWAAASCASSGK